MTPDEIVSEIFKIQNEANPDADPGDLTIDIQDDMELVAIFQMSWDMEQRIEPLGMGKNIQAALEDALKKVRNA